MENNILLLNPIQKDYIWGTEKWLFSSLHHELPSAPFLMKEILSRQSLSLQVHPDDDFAKQMEGSPGKTEMWYILDCPTNAFLYYGLKHKVSLEELNKRIENRTILEICRKVPVNKGDVFYLPAGIIHAIGPGIRLLEVQQNSNITYRIYDYDRKLPDNQPRPLHIEKALQVSCCLPPFFGHEPMGCRIDKDGYSKTLLVQCPYFKVLLYEVEKEALLPGETSQALVILEGQGRLQRDNFTLEIEAGKTLFLPGSESNYMLHGKIKTVAVCTPSDRTD
ncbi:MAG: mannose-6-phosphate isomerase [Lachnospiraceae bacterium]